MGIKMNMIKTMMWKNWILRKRHWFVTIIEAAAPCAIFIILLYARFNIGDGYSPKVSIPAYKSSPSSGDSCFNSAGVFNSHYVVAFAPANFNESDIMNRVKNKIWIDRSQIGINHENFQQSHLLEMKPMSSEREMEEYYQTLMVNDTFTIFYGVVFNEVSDKKFDYKVRIGNFLGSFYTDQLLPQIILPGRGHTGDNYIKYCFLTLQKHLDIAYIEQKTSKNLSSSQIMMQEIPYPEFSPKDVEFQTMLSLILPMIIIFSFCIILPNVIKRVVEEKETGVKELMKMMGLRSWMVWFGWLLHANMINIFVTIISTVLMTVMFRENVPPVLPYTNPFFVWLLLFLFMNASTVFLFIICAFIHRPLIASSAGMMLYFIPPLALSYVTVQQYSSIWVKLMMCLIPTLGLKEGFHIIFAYNSRAIGVQFYNLFTSATDEKDDLSLGLVFIMLIVDMVLFGIITWYIDNVRPGPYGRAKPWHFVFSMLFRKKYDDNILVPDEDEDSDSIHFETPPAHLSVGLSVRNLKKVFPPNIPAVNGVNIDIFKGQITALLGHNGAGKTTTMSMLTGLFSPTSGTVHQHVTDTKYINIFDNMDHFRQDLGLCPQHSMLFSYFTVIEHLLFFGMLKGIPIEQARREGRQLLQMLNIIDKASVTVDKLSGGMKRKLSLAISLIGSPKVLMLDEPTSGMDPESRREMWDILLNLREGRTIIITTHFMEEADVLGDRIAIMDHGKVRCYGTTMFLKKVYGAGYNMTLLTQPNAQVHKITDLVTNAIPGSKLRTCHQGQLVYNLPSESSSSFAPLFAEIEEKKAELLVTSIGVSCTTMEEVFLKVGDIADMERNQEMDKTSNNSQDNNFNKSSSTEHLSPKRMSGMKLVCQQFYMLLLKKVKFTYRKLLSYLFFTFLAVLMIGIAVGSSSNQSGDNTVPSLKVSLDLYKGTEVFVTYNKEGETYADTYEKLITFSKVHQLPGKNITVELLDIATKNIERFRLKVMAAADWTGNNGTSLYSSIGTHSSPASLNLVSNTLLKSYRKDSSITTYNHPFSKESLSTCTSGSVSIEKYIAGMRWVMTVPFGLLFVVANFLAFPLHERVNSAKHLQLMTGLSPVVYWLSSFVWDYLVFIFTSFLLTIPIFIFDDINMVKKPYELSTLLLIINLYGLSGIPFAYFFSFLKKSSAGASSSFIFYNTIFGIAGSLAVQILGGIKLLTGSLHTFVDGLLMLNPYYCVATAIFNYSTMAFEKAICVQCQLTTNCGEEKSYMAFKSDTNPNGIGLYLLVLSLDWILYVAIILLIDYGLMAKFANFLKSLYVTQADIGNLDSDVQDELDRVDAARLNQGGSSPVLMVDGLKKTYGRNFLAVRGISFAVNSGECFGLLGVNGAGKTTTFKMLTGDEVPTGGSASVTKYSLLEDRSQYLAQIGYCPQFDAINELMTGREMLNLFGQLRGISPNDASHLTDYWLKFLGLDEYSDRLCGTYSGGNKRKLSTAMALIGDPVIVFLDEPTSGVDPVARRRLWHVLARCQKGGQSIVLTSHSMDECEALCNRLTIMVKGQLVCIGNIQYLKQKFGQGFTIMVKLHVVNQTNQVLQQLKRDIEQTFAPHCILKDEHTGLLHYHVTDTSKTWSMLFQSMDDIKKKHALVEDYTISETTLEQVFISFAKRQ